MRVCVLADEIFGNYSPELHLKHHEWKMYNVKLPAYEFIRGIAMRETYDVFLNLCDGAEDEADRPGMDVVQALETLNLPFTGADSGFYAPTREGMQALAVKKGIGFARGIQVFENENVVAKVAAAGFRYPMIVKHHDSYASAGMTRDNRVENSKQLKSQFQKMASHYGSARIEEFIEGREFTCLVADNPDDLDEPYVYQPVEILFQQGETFKHWAMKFDADASADMDLEFVSESGLARRIKNMTKKMYLAMGGTGYGRADIRMDRDGSLFMLEMNPSPSVLNMEDDFTSADYMMQEDPGGTEGFLDRIFRSAILRLEMRKMPVPLQLPRRRRLEPVAARK
ncbi:MAG: D-alanine--D-alanine ligase [Anaerolineales bacterium]|nr:D-alanine--D-alanine ligase [Anaerolineales bacterium]